MKIKFKYLIFILLIITASSYADTIDQQRHNYQIAKNACSKNNINVLYKVLPKLKNYPLYPDIQYEIEVQKINNDIDISSTAISINAFIEKYQNLPLANLISNQFISYLAKKKQWKTLVDFSSKPPYQIRSLCNWYYARAFVKNEPVNFNTLVNKLINRFNIPSDCNKLFFIADKNIKPSSINVVNTIEFIRLAMQAHNDNLVNFLIKILPADYKNTADWILALKKQPLSITDFIKKVKPSPFTLQAIKYSLFHLSHKNFELARTTIPIILNLYKMQSSDIQSLKEIVASDMMHENISFAQEKWRDKVIMHSKSISLIERRIRLSLMRNDMNGLKKLIFHLPARAKEKDEWQYWLSYIFYRQGDKKKGDNILHKLMQKNGFYSLVAAQKLGLIYPFRQDHAPAPDSSIPKLKEINRIRELIYWKKYNLAKIEWQHLIANKSIRKKKMLARYANEQHWWHLSVHTTIDAKIWHNIKERFPLAWHNMYKKYTDNKNIPKNYAMAVARQESGWNPVAHSLMNAMGLMQLEPSAIKQTIKVYKIKRLFDFKSILDPEINIWIGTSYLEYIFKHLGNNRVLTSAAYNAGLTTMNSWRHRSAGKLNVIAFIEAIPFKETRQYVKNVLLYNAYYNYLTGTPRNILTLNEWRDHY
ncbi:murein transglycosylase [Candidatus Pantoea edessiphila]|uniref:Murein transglycosylase n=1 Tax=Candidatus Pantoea edessiphila TaxID=2044610 RepID=A0A2P5SY60_9GAMM|nr:murein transglycosylase [Candidatus Pantoea edessiphila]MBK4775621.1 murein transglycosylase [Pantoea sp. Edef]PPI87268.1 murein transglycosylase [Candidatus Pantoea edessiphila]